MRNSRPASITQTKRLRGPWRGPATAFLAAVVLCWAAVLPGAQEPAKKEAAAPAKAEAKPATYVGSETCQACHEDLYKAIQKSPHQAVDKSARWGRQGQVCEACHGPGSVHAESASATDIKNPAKLPVSQADKTCLGCHLNQPTHAGRIQSSHAKNQVACVACHSVHKTDQESLVARKASTINQRCAACHASVWAGFQKPYKHRLPEGAMSCVDCHNPHGSTVLGMRQTFAANEPGCLKCHGDKRGPFAYEHAPVRLEGCTSCHQPHGSANPRMMTRADVRFLCLECHANLPLPTAPQGVIGGTVPPGFHNLNSPRFRNCTICHVKVHGSQVNRSLLR
jgi:DmsE family decaheme c-type cytochrome